MGMTKLKSLPLTKISIDDSFWDKYIKLVQEVIIPYQWEILNDRVEGAKPSHCINNFKITAKEKEGEFQGAVFQDSDVAKWLEAVAYSLSTNPNKELEKSADEVIHLFGKAQDETGYLNTYYTIKEPNLRWTNLKEGHELYTSGHMIEAAIAYYKATGKDEFLQIMIRNADLICDVFSKDKNSEGYPGHQEIELALVKLFEVTGNKKYIDQAKAFINRRGHRPYYFDKEEKRPEYKRIFQEFAEYLPLYSQSHLPVREQKTAEGHAVRAVYMYCAMADLAYYYNDLELLESCKRLWDNITTKRMYITGAIGSSGILERFTTDYDLPNSSNYGETCASIGLALFGRRMMQITRDGKYMDVVEKALYNTVLSGIAMDGRSFFYVNPLEVWPDNCLVRTSMEHVKPMRQKWFGVACCPPNITRTLASLGEYIYSQTDNTLWINLFVEGSIGVNIQKKDLVVTTKTKFPFEGNISIQLEGNDDLEFDLAIRIPGYVNKYNILVDGINIQDKDCDKGYKYIKINGQKLIEVSFDLSPRFVRANPLVREDSGKVAIEKGPLVYCIEEIDNESNLPAYFVDTKQPINEEYYEGLLGGTTVLKLKGKKISQDNWTLDELYKETDVVWENKDLIAIPYCYWGNRTPGEMLVWMKEYYGG
ncbi:MAG: glycoside hydrolase family 127 protein [Anaerolineaceae bacterium]|nr:MAG: glycoside hydrolase family 127 protein [Anaerolineaceae bacterium]